MSAIINQVDRSLETLPNSQQQVSEENNMVNQTQTTPSEYTLNQPSIFSSDVDNWIAGPDTANTGVQGSGIPSIQRSTLVTSSMGSNGVWYLLAMVLPLFSVNHGAWRATPSTILYTAEILFLKLGRACGHISHQIRHLAQNRDHRDVFATALDVVLVVYAIGFLVLSMYQASFTGNL